MKHRRPSFRLGQLLSGLATALLVAWPCAGPAGAQFDALGWTKIKDPGYPSTSVVVNGDMLKVTGPAYPEPCLAPALVYAVSTAPFDATVSVRLYFDADLSVAGLETPLYLVGSTFQLLPEACMDCEVVLHVLAGEIFAFGNQSHDCLFANPTSIWSKLRLFPEPQLASIAGSAASEGFGQAVANIGDIDLDGVDDFAVGAPHAASSGPDSGRVAVYSGHDSSPLFAVDGPAPGVCFGASIAGVGDIDHDGIPDLLVGAPQAGFAGPASGRAYVLSGAAGALLGTHDGDSAGLQFAHSVAAAGDLDGDDTPDLLVGAPGSELSGESAGSAVVISGRTGDVLMTVRGTSASERCGFAVAGVNDLNADGIRDLIVGSPCASPGALPRAGLVRTLSGATGEVMVTLSGNSAGGRFGAALAALGDLDADGVPDIAVGAPDTDAAAAHVGRVSMHSGRDGSLLHTSVGNTAGDRFGWSVCAAGDIDLDGLTDIVVGALGSGAVDPGAGGTARILSGRDASVIAIFDTTSSGDQFGAAVAGAGDLDADGVPDVLVGAPGADVVEPDAGRIARLTHIRVLFADLGGGVAGSNGTPTLAAKGLLYAGGPLMLFIEHGAVHSWIVLVLGFTELAAPFKGGVLWPQPLAVSPACALDENGALTYYATWPDGAPSGLGLLLQGVQPDPAAEQGVAATNGLRISGP